MPPVVEVATVKFPAVTSTLVLVAVSRIPAAFELCIAAEVVIDAHVTVSAPPIVTVPPELVNVPEPLQFIVRLKFDVLETAVETVIEPRLCRVTFREPSCPKSEAGVMFEVPVELVYQLPLSHSPPGSRVEFETVIEDGKPLVVTADEAADQVPILPFKTGATRKT
jgi:hypothetical protein